MLAVPMLRDIAAGAKPHLTVLTGMLEKSYQTDRLGGATDQPVVKVDRHHFGLRGALLVKQVKAIYHVASKSLGRAKSGVAVEAVIIGFVGRRDHKMAALADLDPKWQLVAEVIAVIEKAAIFNQQTSSVVARPAVEPADWCLPGKLLEADDGEVNMLALGLFVDLEII